MSSKKSKTEATQRVPNLVELFRSSGDEPKQTQEQPKQTQEQPKQTREHLKQIREQSKQSPRDEISGGDETIPPKIEKTEKEKTVPPDRTIELNLQVVFPLDFPAIINFRIGDNTQQLKVFSQNEIVAGRDTGKKNIDLPLDTSEKISRRQFKIFREQQDLYLQNLSQYGTKVGNQIYQKDQLKLSEQEHLEVGEGVHYLLRTFISPCKLNIPNLGTVMAKGRNLFIEKISQREIFYILLSDILHFQVTEDNIIYPVDKSSLSIFLHNKWLWIHEKENCYLLYPGCQYTLENCEVSVSSESAKDQS